jgi:hypothetical protein
VFVVSPAGTCEETERSLTSCYDCCVSEEVVCGIERGCVSGVAAMGGSDCAVAVDIAGSADGGAAERLEGTDVGEVDERSVKIKDLVALEVVLSWLRVCFDEL